MNLENLNVQVLNTQELTSVDGGWYIDPGFFDVVLSSSFWEGVGDGFMMTVNDMIDGFNDGSGANCN